MISLHRLIPDNELPVPLKMKLVFGDRDQIKSLEALEDRINTLETEKAKVANGELRYFEVVVDYSGTDYIKVLAIDAGDAEEKAREMVNFDDVGIDSARAREIKNGGSNCL